VVALALPAAVLAQSDATLTNLAPSAGTLTPAFAGGTFRYTATVPYATASMTVTPFAADTNATITVNGRPVTSGNPSGAISLRPGTNGITTVVVSAGATATNTYTLTVTRAGEVPVPIANPSFEDLLSAGDGSDGDYDYATDPAGGYYYTWPLPNWGYYGQDYSGMLNPTDGMISGPAPEGQCVGFVEADTRADPGPLTGGLTQVLGTDLTADTAYTLTVKVGNPLKVDYTAANTFPGYRVQLWAGGNLLAEDANTLPVPQGEWVASTVVHSSGASVAPGQKLEIRLVNMGISPGGTKQDHYVLYDDVQLTATPPPPTALILVVR